ncbi:hypothetical protein ABIB62_002993 [Mucilaginibacter sp. UYP25]|uniref:hypothetical protein n=1 Tax=unclassified Mucilaginibacter TaxID=2617802 RepID=UPI00339426FE
MAKETQTNPVIIKIPLEEEKNAANLMAYVVDKEGKVTESHPLRSGEARLATSAANLHASKLYIAPELPKEAGKTTVTESVLQQMEAWQPSLRIPSDGIFRLPYIPAFPYPFQFGWCNISGAVHKTFNVNGHPEVLNICNSRVHICNITPIRILIPHIPINILKDLRDRLVAVIKKPIPIPDPGPIRTSFTNALKRSIAPGNNFYELADVHELVEKLPIRPTLPENIQNAILSGSMESFNKTIANNFNLFHPYLCWWPWFWPYFYKSTPIATVVTDCHGRFNYNMFYFKANHPNVYVWVEVLINGVWVTVYKPAISCHTYWNYACGTDINVSVTNPAVRPCFCDSPAIEANYVWVKSVNRGVSVRSIQQQETASGHLDNAVGLTAYSNKGNISPFGGGFSLVLQFGDGLAGFGVTHYRWTSQLLKDAYLGNNVGSPETLGGSVAKAYSHWIQVAPGDWEHVPGSFALGPYLDSTGKVMYKIPHIHASADTGLADAVWDTGIDTDAININTVGWTPGLYQFTIELLNNNGQVVPLNYNPFKVSKIATDGGPAVGDTIDADLAGNGYVKRDVSNHVTGFNFLMRVDNDYCYAGISDALVDGHSTDTECGTGYYDDKFNDKVDLIFQAGHAHNFATYGFNVYKGNSGALGAAASAGTSANANNLLNVTTGDNVYDITQVTFGPAQAPPAVQNPINRVANMDQYHKAIGVSDMLGTCTMAAFSENLNVYATHTNGNDRLSQYDAHYIAAIAVAPKS